MSNVSLYIPSLLLVLLSSCGLYNSSFDCPHGKGVGCVRVGEVLDMIVERDEGEDLFIKERGTPMVVRLVEGQNGGLIQDEWAPRQKRKKKKQEPLQLVQGSDGELVLQADEAAEIKPLRTIQELEPKLIEGTEGSLVLEENLLQEREMEKKGSCLQLIQDSHGNFVIVNEELAQGD